MSWENVRLGDYVKIKTGKLDANASSENGLYPFFTCSKEPLKIETYSYDCECVLVAGNGDLNAKYYEGKFDAYQRTYIIESIDKEKLHVKYLYYFLSEYLTYLREQSIGGVIKYIKLENLTDAKLPLPTITIQKRIAEILDAADTLRRKDQELLRKYDELAQAVFIDMFGDPVRNEKGWKKIPFAELFDSRLGKMLDAKKQVGGTKYKYLGNSNVQWFRYNLDNLSEMEFADNEIEKFELKKGDILICEGGEVGRSAIWNNEMSNVYFQKAIHRARVISDNISSEYTVMLFWFLAKFGGLNDYVTAATIAHLTGEKLKTIPIPVPPIELQNKYRDAVIELKKQKDLFAKSELFSENMFDSLLQQAFKGELV